jgi:phosphatidylserine decarboxylase
MDCTKLWIKGDEFSVESLLGPRSDLIDRYLNGSLVISRLAPQDYHRWHLPVCGKLLSCTPIEGALFTVNPMAINQSQLNMNHIINLYSMMLIVFLLFLCSFFSSLSLCVFVCLCVRCECIYSE